MLRKFIILVLIAPLVLTAMPTFDETTPAQAEDPTDEERVEALMDNMSVQQKIGQLFMVTLYGSRLLESNADFIRTYQPGAIALFGSNLDYQSASETTELINSIQTVSTENSGIPMIVSTDQEGGYVWRLINGFTHFPDPMYLGAMTPEMAFQIGQAVAREISAVGVNMNLAPVVDLTTRDDALTEVRVMHRRTMGENPDRVGTNAGYFIQGMQSVDVMGVLKHFPGHSPTITDSHRALAQVDLPLDEFMDTNFKAFDVGIENGAEVVMVGHLYYPALEPTERLPASLSPTVMNLLREDAGFDGVIMTDAFDMGAIQNNFELTTAAIIAIRAGVDMVAMGPNMAFSQQKEMIEQVWEAYEQGLISEERIDQSVRRVLLLKAKYGILDWKPLEPTAADERIQVDMTTNLLISAFADAMTVVQDGNNILPLEETDNITIMHPAGWFDIPNECRLYFPDAEYLGYSWNPADWEYGAAISNANEADVTIFFAQDLFVNSGMRNLLNLLPPEKVMFVSLGTPYDYDLLDIQPAGYMVGYSALPSAQIAACRVLAGRIRANGTLPVELDSFDEGTQHYYTLRQ